MSKPQFASRAHELRAHDLQRRAERVGEGIRASLETHLGRGSRARATDSTLSPLARLQRAADATMGEYHATADTRAVHYDEDGNEIEDGQSNFGFVEEEGSAEDLKAVPIRKGAKVSPLPSTKPVSKATSVRTARKRER